MSDTPRPKGVFTPQQYMRLTGCIVIATFLAQAVFQQSQKRVYQREQKWKNFNGWFYNTREQWLEQTGLSRYQQERARKWMRDHGLLVEKKTRLNTGILVWYKVDRVRLYSLLNTMAGQSTVDMVSQSANEKEGEVNVDQQDSSNLPDGCKPDDKNRANAQENTPIGSFNGENGTIVQDNITVYDDFNSDINCLNEGVQPQTPEITGQAVTPPSPSRKLTNKPVNHNDHPFMKGGLVPRPAHSLNACDYEDCHPYIYQWVRTVLTPVLRGVRTTDDYHLYRCFKGFSFDALHVRESLDHFIECHGQAIRSHYLKTSPVEIPPLDQDDIDHALTKRIGL